MFGVCEFIVLFLVGFCVCSFRLLLCLIVVALCWSGDSRVYGQLLISRGKELNCAFDGNQGVSIASDFFLLIG